MKITSTTRLPKADLNEAMMGDTHSQLAVSLAKVDRGMQALGLTPHGMDPEVVGHDTAHGGRTQAKGWRSVFFIFSRSPQEAQQGVGIKFTLDRCWYERNSGSIKITKENSFGVTKGLEFTLKDVVGELDPKEVYEVVKLENKGLADPSLTNAYRYMVAKKVVGSRKAS